MRVERWLTINTKKNAGNVTFHERFQKLSYVQITHVAVLGGYFFVWSVEGWTTYPIYARVFGQSTKDYSELRKLNFANKLFFKRFIQLLSSLSSRARTPRVRMPFRLPAAVGVN